MERSRCELDADGGLGLEAELVAGEAGEQVGLADAGVPDEHHLEEVVVLLLRAPPGHRTGSDWISPCLSSSPSLSLSLSVEREEGRVT
jgi:hypothetical protein